MSVDSLRTLGDPNADLMFVVEAPTQEDMEAGTLLSGWDGRLISTSTSFPRIQVVSVFPTPITKKSKLDEVVEDFWAEMGKRSAKMVIPFGSIALRALMGDSYSNIEDWRGYFIRPTDVSDLAIRRKELTVYKSSRKATAKYPGHAKGDPRTIMRKHNFIPILPRSIEEIVPTITPAAVKKSGLALLDVMYGDIHKAVLVLSRVELPPPDASSFKFNSLPIAPAKIIAVDTETQWNSLRVTDIGLSDGKNTSSTPMPDTNAFAPIFAQCETMIAHNAAFDYTVLSPTYDLSHIKVWDTMLAAYMLCPDAKKSLNWVVSQHLFARRHKHLSHSNPALYNALDTKQAFELYNILKVRLGTQLRFFENGMMPAIPTLSRMSSRGIKVDLAWAKEWRAKIDMQRRALWGKMTNLQQAVVNRPRALAAYFKVRNADEETLKKLILKGHPETDFINAALEFRGLAKNLSTYARTVPQIFPHYLPGARDVDEGNKGIAYSGRPTASNPNIQNQPKEARRQYIPFTGQTFASLDWSQIEPRITAAVSGDDNLAHDIEAGLYDAVARTLSCPRDVAKTVVLLSAYLGSPRTMQNKLMLRGINIPYAECKALQAKMFARYANWSRWREKVINEASWKRMLDNPFGKRAFFNRPHPAKAVNFIPQSTAACILWYCLPAVEKAIEPHGGTIVTTVHDEILIQAPDKTIGQAAEAAKRVMTAEWDVVAKGFRVPVKIKYGKNWRDMDVEDSPWLMFEERA